MKGVRITLPLWLALLTCLYFQWPLTKLPTVLPPPPPQLVDILEAKASVKVTLDADVELNSIPKSTAYCYMTADQSLECVMLPNTIAEEEVTDSHQTSSGYEIEEATQATTTTITGSALYWLVQAKWLWRQTKRHVSSARGSLTLLYSNLRLHQPVYHDKGADNWVAVTLSLIAIGSFVLFWARWVGWCFRYTKAGRRLKIRLAKTPFWIVLRSTAVISALLILALDQILQRMALLLTALVYLLYRWLLWYWREKEAEVLLTLALQQNEEVAASPGEQTRRLCAVQTWIENERWTDIAFYFSYCLALCIFAYLFNEPILTGFVLFGFYAFTLCVRYHHRPVVCSNLNTAGRPCQLPVRHTGPGHRYWSALEILTPTTILVTVSTFLLPFSEYTFAVAPLFSMTLPLLTWCPLLFLLLLVGHYQFRHRVLLSYFPMQMVILLFIGLVFATCHFHGWPSWHLLFIVLFGLAKFLDLNSRFEWEWLHWTMLSLCVSVWVWKLRGLVEFQQ